MPQHRVRRRASPGELMVTADSALDPDTAPSTTAPPGRATAPDLHSSRRSGEDPAGSPATVRAVADATTRSEGRTMSYTLGEAAKATGRNKSTILRAIKAGVLSATREALLHGSGRWRCRSSRSSRTTSHLPPDAQHALQAEPGPSPAYSPAEAQGNELA